MSVPTNTPLIVAAGTSADGTSFAVIRYLEADGSRDTSWGTGGLVTTSFAVDHLDTAYGIAVQADGKVVVVGSDQDTNTFEAFFAVARYNTDGSLDTGFGTGGLFTTNFAAGTDTAAIALAVAIQADGKIVVAGSGDSGSGSTFALIRLTTAGALDSGFGTGGKVVTALDGAGNSYTQIGSLVVQGDGKIVAAGIGNVVATIKTVFALARYNTDGSLDTTGFGTGGLTITSFTANSDAAHAVTLQADGKVVAAGYAGQGSGTTTFALARYTSAGVLDTLTFGTLGKVVFGFGTAGEIDAEALAVAVQPADQKIVVTGGANGDAVQTALARLTTAGALDGTFGTGGKATTTFPGVNSSALGAMLLQAGDGRIVTTAQNLLAGAFLIARYLTNGAPDNSWGTMSLVSDAGGIGPFALAQQTIAPPPPPGTGGDHLPMLGCS